MTEITRESCKVIRSELEQAIEDVAKRHGLVANLGRMTFLDGTNLSAKVTIVQPAEGVKQSLTPNVGEVWLIGGKEYTITRVLPSILATRFMRSGLQREYRVTMDVLNTGARIR